MTVHLEVDNNVVKRTYGPVFSCAELAKVFGGPGATGQRCAKTEKIEAYLGTMSLKSSNLILPAGVSPICMSMKTIGLCILAGPRVDESENSDRIRSEISLIFIKYRFYFTRPNVT